MTAAGATTTFTSGGSGILAVNQDSGSFAGSTIDVTAYYGTIDSGAADNTNGSAPAGIEAGYQNNGGAGSAAGNVTVDNYANITAAQGSGIHAFMNGTAAGNVSVTDAADTTIKALTASTGTGGSPTGIKATIEGTGSITVETSPGDVIDSGSAGIVAKNQALAIPSAANSQVSIAAYGIINSGTIATDDGNAPAGIIAAYGGDGTVGNAANPNVYGNVTIDNYATITATGGDGIRAADFGVGTVTVDNEASVTGPTGLETITAEASDVVKITNEGTITGNGTSAAPVVQIKQSGGSASVTNSGTIESTTVSPSAVAIFETGGTLSLTNSGLIVGQVTADAAIDNQSGGVWDVTGTNSFGGTTTITNAGTINVEGNASFITSGTLNIDNTGHINIESGALTISGATVTGTGSFTVDVGATLTLNGTDTLSGDLNNNGTITVGGTLDLSGGTLSAGGTIVDNGAIDTSGTSAIDKASISGGKLTVESGTLTLGSANTLTNVDVSNAGGSLNNSGALTLNGTDTLSGDLNNTGTITVGGTLDLSGGMLSAGGTIVDNGAIDTSATSAIDKASISGGKLTVESGTLTLGSANTLTNVDVSNAGGSLNNSGALTLNGTDTLSGDLNNTGTITVGGTLDLSGGTLSAGGTIVDNGAIDTSGTSAIDNATITGGTLTVESGALTLSGDTLTNVAIIGLGALDIAGAVQGYGSIGGTLALTTETTSAVIDADVSGKTLTLDPGGMITNNGTLEATNGGTLLIDNPVTGSGTVLVEGSTVELATSESGVAITFNNAAGTDYGALILETASAFNIGHIIGFAGTAAGSTATSDEVVLTGYATGAITDSSSYNSMDNLTSLLISNHTTPAITLEFVGNVNLVVDTSGSNVDIFDPPTTGSASDPAVISTATSTSTLESTSGNLSFADTHTGDTFTDSVTTDGSNYAGNLSLDQPTESNGHVSVDFDFMADKDQMNLAPGQTVTQSYNVSVADAQNPAENLNQTVSVTVGGAGNDHFVFAPGVGADTVTNFNPQHDTLELDHFANAQTVHELQSLITPDVHGDAVINLGHNDSVTLAGVTDAQLQHLIQVGHVLLH